MSPTPLTEPLKRSLIAQAEAAGKLILMGEHSVVYGERALALALPRGLEAKAYLRPETAPSETAPSETAPSETAPSETAPSETAPSETAPSETAPSETAPSETAPSETQQSDSTRGPTLTLSSLGLSVRLCERARPTHPLSERLWLAWREAWAALDDGSLGALSSPQLSCGAARERLEIEVEGRLPFKVGLGSSAALSIALLKTLASLHALHPTQTQLSEGAMRLERVFHGDPSGLDHSVALTGGLLAFERGEEGPRLSPLTLTLPLSLVVCWVPREGGTAEAVAHVKRLLEREPEHREHVRALGRLTREVEELLTSQGSDKSSLERVAPHEARLRALGELFNQAHQELSALGVSTAALDERCEALRARGALGAKLTGAGFGGAVFGLFERPERAEQVAAELGGLSAHLGY